jgi:hypothetical protein
MKHRMERLRSKPCPHGTDTAGCQPSAARPGHRGSIRTGRCRLARKGEPASIHIGPGPNRMTRRLRLTSPRLCQSSLRRSLPHYCRKPSRVRSRHRRSHKPQGAASSRARARSESWRESFRARIRPIVTPRNQGAVVGHAVPPGARAIMLVPPRSGPWLRDSHRPRCRAGIVPTSRTRGLRIEPSEPPEMWLCPNRGPEPARTARPASDADAG